MTRARTCILILPDTLSGVSKSYEMYVPSSFSTNRRTLTWRDITTQHLDPLADDALLQYYAQEWHRYTTGVKYINRALAPLNRHWANQKSDRKGVCTVELVSDVSCLKRRSHLLTLFCQARSFPMEAEPFPPCAEQAGEAHGRHSKSYRTAEER